MKAYITFDTDRLKRAMLADLSDDELVRVRDMEVVVCLTDHPAKSPYEFEVDLSFRSPA